MGWSEDVWDFAPLKEGKTPILRNNDSNMTTMLQTKEIASAADLKNIKNDLSGVCSDYRYRYIGISVGNSGYPGNI